LRRAHEQGQDFVDDTVLQAVLDECLDVVKP